MRSILEYAAAAWAPWLSATSTRKLENVQLEAARAITGIFRPTPDEAVLAKSQLPSISTHCQTISLLKADEWAHLLPAADHRQTLFTACRQRLKKKDWLNTLFLCPNQLGLNAQVLTPTPPSCEQLSIPPWDKPPPIPTVITPVDKIMSPSKQRELSLQTFASIPPADIQIFTDGSVRDGIEYGGASLVVLSQDDLIHDWHAPTGTHSSSFQAEKAAFKEAIQWLSSISSWGSAIITCDCKSLVQAVSNANAADSSVMIRVEVATSRPDHLPTLSAAKTSERSLPTNSSNITSWRLMRRANNNNLPSPP